MSVNAQVHLSSNENNKKSDKTLKPLFPKRDECSHVSCYWYILFFFPFLFYFIYVVLYLLFFCLTLQWGKRMEALSGCFITYSGGIRSMFRRFYIKSLSHGALMETKGRAWGWSSRHMGVYWIMSRYRMYNSNNR